LDKKIAQISHKKVANRVDAFGVLVTGGDQHLSSVGAIWAPFNLGGPFLCSTPKEMVAAVTPTRGAEGAWGVEATEPN
jgi:hypothetical protein